MAASGCPCDPDPVWIDSVGARISAQIPNRTLAVLDVGGKWAITTESIKDARCHKSGIGEHERARIPVLIPTLPAATMKPENGGRGFGSRYRYKDVHQ